MMSDMFLGISNLNSAYGPAKSRLIMAGRGKEVKPQRRAGGGK
ncbi:MAG: hypothetical protein ABFD90_19740 [Phycisphaerales bacterium]